MLGFTPLQLGLFLAGIALLGLGVALAVRYGKQVLVKPAAPAAVPSLPQPMPDWSESNTAPADGDGFFGGAVAASPTVTPYRGGSLATSTKAPSPVGSQSIVLLVVGVILAVGGAFTAYHTWSTRGLIHMPDQLLGLQKATPDSPLGQAFKSAEEDFKSNDELAKMQYGLYGDPTEFIMVTAGEVGQASSGDVFGGLDQDLTNSGLPGVTLHKADPGSLGGQVECATMTEQKMTVCFWASAGSAQGHGVAGAVLFNGAITDNYDLAMQQIRTAIAGKNG